MTNSKNQPTYEAIEVSKLKLGDYQRSPELTRIKKIAKFFDQNQLGTLKVSFRDGQHWVFDGQHRLMACKTLGIDFVMCEVHTGLTYEDEAMLFYKQSDNHKSLTAGEKFNGRVEANESKAVELKAIVENCGFRILYAGGKSMFKISAVATLEKIEKIYGKEVLVSTLTLINKTWSGIPESTDARMLMGVALFVKNNEGFNPVSFIKKLSRVTPIEIMRKGDSDLANGEYKPYEIVIKQCYEKGNRKQ